MCVVMEKCIENFVQAWVMFTSEWAMPHVINESVEQWQAPSEVWSQEHSYRNQARELELFPESKHNYALHTHISVVMMHR